MQLLLDIISFMKSNNFVNGDGIDAFRDYIPDSPDEVVVVSEYAGDGFNPYDENMTHRSFQISVRSINATTAKNKAYNISKSFRAPGNYVKLTLSTWALVYVRNLPIKIKTDENKRTTYAFNIGITSNV